MTSRQQNVYKRNLTVEDVMEELNAVTDNLPNYGPIFQEFMKGNREIERLRRIQESDESGTTAKKAKLRVSLELATARIGGKLVALLEAAEAYEKLSRVKFTDSDLRNASDSDLHKMSSQVYNLALEHEAGLVAYKISAADLTDYQTSLENFHSNITKTTTVVQNRSKATEALEAQFEKSEELLGKLDTILKSARFEHPDEYLSFTNAKKIIDLAGSGGSLSFRASTKDAKGNPISNVTFEIISSGELQKLARLDGAAYKPQPVVVKKTSEKGNLNVKDLADGTYSAIVKKLGFQEKQVQFHVVGGELVNLDVVLEEA